MKQKHYLWTTHVQYGVIQIKICNYMQNIKSTDTSNYRNVSSTHTVQAIIEMCV